jgi:5-methyltetrahydrofolate--homocysteine methyltransferase
MHTVLRSASKEVVIGDDQPFCIIGERINPTGRKLFQDQLRSGDLSRIEIDVAQQVAGGAMVLDINMGAALVDEVGLMTKAVKIVQALTDLPLCIDSSMIEVLEAGLSTYAGKALVNSVTAEDERLEAILPLVKRYGAAVIALPNDENEIPEQPKRRLELARKIVDVATGEYHIAIEDIVLDPLAMPISADTSLVVRTLETISLEHDRRGLQRVVRDARPRDHRGDVPRDGDQGGPHERHHGRAFAATRAYRQGHRSAAGSGPMGNVLDHRAPLPAGLREHMTSQPVRR